VKRFAQIAQLVEHAIENRSVAGSIPALGTIFPFFSSNPLRSCHADDHHGDENQRSHRAKGN
jgi:hypothetical protein